VSAHQQGLPGGEGHEVFGLGQLGEQRIRVDVEALLAGTRAKVEIQTPLETLLYELGVGRHL
jgi:hypothetical protein